MKVTFLGAAGSEVTGSAYLLETKHANVLVDCGFFQGSRTAENYNRIPKKGAPLHKDPVPFKNADVVFMESTYGAAADHCGPLSTQRGVPGGSTNRSRSSDPQVNS